MSKQQGWIPRLQAYLFSMYILFVLVLVVMWIAFFLYFVSNLDFIGLAFWIIITAGIAFGFMYFPKRFKVSTEP